MRKNIFAISFSLFLGLAFLLVPSMGIQIHTANAQEISQEVKYYNRLGNQYNTDGMYDKAIECFNTAIRINPNIGKLYYNRAIVYGNKGMLDQALADYSRALGLNPNDADTYYNCAVIREKMKMWQAAAANYREAAKINPNLVNDPQFKERWDRAEREHLRNVASTYGANVSHVLNNYKTVEQWQGSMEFQELQRKSSSGGSWDYNNGHGY